jgi:cytochrome c oxidase subunit 2
VDKFIIYIHYLMIALFIGWSAYFLYAIWRFRSSRHPKADYVGVTSHASSYLELAVAAVEVVLLVLFAIPLWAKVVDHYPDQDKAQLIRVTAQQFSWSGRYPGPDGKFGKQDISLVSTTNKMGLLQLNDDFKKDDPDGKDDILLGDAVRER